MIKNFALLTIVALSISSLSFAEAPQAVPIVFGDHINTYTLSESLSVTSSESEGPRVCTERLAQKLLDLLPNNITRVMHSPELADHQSFLAISGNKFLVSTDDKKDEQQATLWGWMRISPAKKNVSGFSCGLNVMDVRESQSQLILKTPQNEIELRVVGVLPEPTWNLGVPQTTYDHF